MASPRGDDPTSDEDPQVVPVEAADCVKPVELIELLQRRTAKRKRPKVPTTSPFYDADFVARHPTRRKRRSD